MRTIDITTTQKVAIEYELGSLRERFMAFFIDIVIIFCSAFIISILFIMLFSERYFNYFVFILPLPIVLFYTLVSELIMNGQTFGKKAMNIKVVKINGKEPAISDYLIRWVFRLIDIWFSSGSIAAILISSTDKNQRLGDILSNCTVIRTRSRIRFSLNDILNIKSIENYTPSYPGVNRYTEEDMLLVKQVLERVTFYPNTAHKEALNALSEKISSQLDLKEVPYDQVEFLKTVLRDYIVITR